MGFVEGRISESAFKVITWVFFAIALLAAGGRIIIRLWLQRRLRPDDYLLLSSCAFLTAATGLLYYGTPSIFLGAKLSLNPNAIYQSGLSEAEILSQTNLIAKFNWSYLALSWVSIFLVKFGFLFLFRQLVNRLPKMYTYWKIVMGFTAVCFAFAVCDGFISCPKLGLAIIQCSSTAALSKGLAVGILAMVLDMLTDLLIVMLPVTLLWRVRMRPSQKIGLGAFLCLSISMILMAITRAAGIHFHGKFDNTWIFIWQQLEACVAVMMLSLTAFRSVFVAAKPNPNDKRAKAWVPSTRRLLGRHKKPGIDDPKPLDTLAIPDPTLTGFTRILDRSQARSSAEDTATSGSWQMTSELSNKQTSTA